MDYPPSTTPARWPTPFLEATMHRLRTLTAGTAAGLLTLVACSDGGDSRPADSSRSTIKIGVIAPLEGPSASLAQSFLEAARVSIDTLPDTKRNYQLVIEDGGTTPEESQRAARRLVEEDGVDAIVGGISKVGEEVAPIASAAKVPQICVCSVPTIGDGQYNFTNIPLGKDEAEAWVAEAKSRGLRTIAVLAQSYKSVDIQVADMKAAAERDGMEVVYEYRFPQGTTEFLKPMQAAGAKNPDVYFVSGGEPSLTALGKQIRVAEEVHGKDLEVASIVAISTSQDLSTFEGAWYTDSDLPSDTVLAQFEKAYPNSEFITHMMPYAYDSVRMLVNGFERGDVVSYLRNLASYDGSNGPITREAGSGNFRSKPVVWVVKNGRPQVQATGRSKPGIVQSPDSDTSQPVNPH
jgi:ABC-type branched-subunit amino acid transport system substrate-binding protein